MWWHWHSWALRMQQLPWELHAHPFMCGPCCAKPIALCFPLMAIVLDSAQPSEHQKLLCRFQETIKKLGFYSCPANMTLIAIFDNTEQLHLNKQSPRQRHCLDSFSNLLAMEMIYLVQRAELKRITPPNLCYSPCPRSLFVHSYCESSQIGQHRVQVNQSSSVTFLNFQRKVLHPHQCRQSGVPNKIPWEPKDKLTAKQVKRPSRPERDISPHCQNQISPQRHPLIYQNTSCVF